MRIVGVTQEPRGAGQALLRVHVEDRHVIAIPPNEIGFGAYHELTQMGAALEPVIGF